MKFAEYISSLPSLNFVLGMMLFVDDGEKTQGSLEFQSRFTRPLKPFLHHSHGPQHAPSGSTRGLFAAILYNKAFFFFSESCVKLIKNSLSKNDVIRHFYSYKTYVLEIYKYNSKRIQSVMSNNCGHFCIAFILSLHFCLIL